MSDDTITIEVDGKSLPARPGQMLIEVTDANGIYVPRFCFHNKLSVAANCRMCLVDVEKAPKPLPACATPVMDGMKVATKSPLALKAQKSVMEFLLINHPLDCPICDQGGECELQDLAMGFGSDVSRYHEGKRVVRDKSIGPLVQTEMTRCIHCTRCVRFGEEIAGLRELGVTGRGEDMEIGTYVEKSMVSELSGNVIDLCPVGALTSKPFRFSARTWEMTQFGGIAPHDALGSNLNFHVSNGRVKRVVPAENDAINEVWLSDRDRFSYEGMYSEDRLTTPLLRENGEWRETTWDTALQAVAERIRDCVVKAGSDKLGGLASANCSSEELYLFQSLIRGMGSQNVDHRLRQVDFGDDAQAPIYPWLGQSLAALESLDAVLIVGGNPRKDLPLLNLRLRKAALKGGRVMYLNPVDFDINYQVAIRHIVPAAALARELAAVAVAADAVPGSRFSAPVTEIHGRIAASLREGEHTAVLLGGLAQSSPLASELRFLAGCLSRQTGARFGYLPDAANSVGAWLSGVLPHRFAAGRENSQPGLHAGAMLTGEPLSSYLLLNTEPELDSLYGSSALRVLRNADNVTCITPNVTPAQREYADVLLPMAVFAENEGSFFSLEGRRQSFRQVVSPPGEARPAWKILRVLGDLLGVNGFDFATFDELQQQLTAELEGVEPDNDGKWRDVEQLTPVNSDVQVQCYVPMNSADALVRRAQSLQQTVDVADGTVHVSPQLAERLGVATADSVRVQTSAGKLTLPLTVDVRVAAETVLLHGGHAGVALLGSLYGGIEIGKG